MRKIISSQINKRIIAGGYKHMSLKKLEAKHFQSKQAKDDLACLY